MPRYGRFDRDYAMRLASSEPATDGPVYMLNLMKYREVADYRSASEKRVSGREADDRYAPVDVLRAIGARVCFVADVLKGSEDWDRVAVVRYPTRRSFIDMQDRSDFQEKHVHKDAGMDHTIVMGTLPDSALPAPSSTGLVLLELWEGGASEVHPSATRFRVEGTIVGDGRRWSSVSYAAVGEDFAAPVGTHHQVLLLHPSVERWQ